MRAEPIRAKLQAREPIGCLIQNFFAAYRTTPSHRNFTSLSAKKPYSIITALRLNVCFLLNFLPLPNLFLLAFFFPAIVFLPL
jgi:hypothetical protein